MQICVCFFRAGRPLVNGKIKKNTSGLPKQHICKWQLLSFLLLVRGEIRTGCIVWVVFALFGYTAICSEALILHSILLTLAIEHGCEFCVWVLSLSDASCDIPNPRKLGFWKLLSCLWNMSYLGSVCSADRSSLRNEKDREGHNRQAGWCWSSL